MIVNPSEKRVQAVFVRLHCRAVAAGMTGRISKTVLLDKAGAITGKKYKRGQHGTAAEDITKWLEAQV